MTESHPTPNAHLPSSILATGFVEDEKLAPPPEVVALYEQSKAKTDGE